jgi:hypothetical protein
LIDLTDPYFDIYRAITGAEINDLTHFSGFFYAKVDKLKLAGKLATVCKYYLYQRHELVANSIDF